MLRLGLPWRLWPVPSLLTTFSLHLFDCFIQCCGNKITPKIKQSSLGWGLFLWWSAITEEFLSLHLEWSYSKGTPVWITPFWRSQQLFCLLTISKSKIMMTNCSCAGCCHWLSQTFYSSSVVNQWLQRPRETHRTPLQVWIKDSIPSFLIFPWCHDCSVALKPANKIQMYFSFQWISTVCGIHFCQVWLLSLSISSNKFHLRKKLLYSLKAERILTSLSFK